MKKKISEIFFFSSFHFLKRTNQTRIAQNENWKIFWKKKKKKFLKIVLYNYVRTMPSR